MGCPTVVAASCCSRSYCHLRPVRHQQPQATPQPPQLLRPQHRDRLQQPRQQQHSILCWPVGDQSVQGCRCCCHLPCTQLPCPDACTDFCCHSRSGSRPACGHAPKSCGTRCQLGSRQLLERLIRQPAHNLPCWGESKCCKHRQELYQLPQRAHVAKALAGTPQLGSCL